MFTSRLLTGVMLSLGVTLAAQAAENPAFTVLEQTDSGQPMLFQSTHPLKKGDVIKVYATNAQQITVMQVAACGSDCSHVHLIGTLPLSAYAVGLTTNSARFVVPQSGYISFWVQPVVGLLSTPLNASNGPWSFARVDPFLLLGQQTPYLMPPNPMPARAFSSDEGGLHARFDHRTFVTVSLADAGQ
ncbi:hypothetical protein DWU98_19090 [Dyella monticola]|uniref:Uncharacterized protein n=1 Tax=Dyella monticola TaxID=1927958 RepID=A0A370WSH4_9GAMM|nr:hypothetical protein [Dyella monticola]RDS79118.1 hypothetical protein DWU98_19090 [Dyella monticola]